MLKDQLFLVVGFKDHGVFVETFDLSYQFYTADQKTVTGALSRRTVLR